MPSLTHAPAFETDHLTFRGHGLDDFEECAALWGDPVVTKHIGGRPFTREEVWSRLLRYFGHWGLLGYGYWAIREKATGRFVGEVGFADLHRDIEPSFEGAPEGGWVLAPWCHGRGYATEALHAALAWLEGARGPGRTVCIIDPGNAASLRVAAKCGYRELVHTTYKGQPTLLLER